MPFSNASNKRGSMLSSLTNGEAVVMECELECTEGCREGEFGKKAKNKLSYGGTNGPS